VLRSSWFKLVLAVVLLSAMGWQLTQADPAGASPSPAVNASGTLDCTMSKGTLVVAPGLMFTGTAPSATFTFTAKLACTGSSGVKGGTLTASGTSASNNCGTLANAGIPRMTATIDWKGRFNPSSIVFSNGNFSIASSVGIHLPSTGPNPPVGSTTVGGSFAFEPVAASFIADQSVAEFAAGCNNSTTGLTGFTFTGVNGASTLAIADSKSTTPPTNPVAPPPAVIGVDAGNPGAAVNENLVGVNHIVSGSQTALQAIGTTWARTDVSFEVNQGTSQAAYNCTTGTWDPTYVDGNIAIDRQAGAQPELIVDYFPYCVDYQRSDLSKPAVATAKKQYEQLVYNMALHEIGVEGVKVFEVWNEPSFYMPLKGADGYLTLYKLTATQLEKAAQKLGVAIEVGGPGVDELGQIDNSWISALAAYVVQHNLPLNFVDWHQYANDPDEGPQGPYPSGICDTGPALNGQPCWFSPNLDVSLYKRGTESVKSILAQYPSLANTVTWVDEWGVDSGNDSRLSGPFGSAFVAASLDNAQQGGMDRMTFYDAADDPNDTAYSNFGLLKGNLTPKPAYYAFAMWHQMAGSLLPVTLTPDQSDAAGAARIGAVASEAADGTVHVLVYNFDPYDPSGSYGASDPTAYDDTVTANLSGLMTGPYGESRSLIDAGTNDAVVSTSTVSGPAVPLSIALPGEAVTLITLTPTS
jgi:hypothetical protein